jgi:molecular chaperone Hsp33
MDSHFVKMWYNMDAWKGYEMNDYLVKAYAFGGTVRIYGATTTNLVEHARQIHDTWPAATAAFGRLLTGGVIMGAMYKGDQTLTIRINGGGPIGAMVVTTNANGGVRGYVEEPHVHMSTNDNKLAVGSVVGNDGVIHVTKDLKVRDIFTSSAELQTGEIAEDLTYYFAMSEQIPSSVGLGVLVGEANQVLSSGGFILQVMPGCKKESLDKIEANIKAMRPVSALIRDQYTPEQIVAEITKGEHEFVERLDLRYECDCHKDKFAKGLIALGDDQLTELIEEGKEIETVCHFCKSAYHFSVDELVKLRLEALRKDDEETA